jgi:serine O-acetyltransferase
MVPQQEVPLNSRSRDGRPGLAACIRADLELLLRNETSTLRRIGMALTNRGLHALLLYRLGRRLWQLGVPAVPMVLTRIAQHLFAVDIDVAAELGPGIVIYHGFGLVIGRGARIEGGCHLFHGVTLGNRGSEWVGSDEPDGQPCLEYNVVVGAGAKILGPVRVGRNSMVGANAVVLKDVPEFAIVAGVPARVIGERPPMDANLRRLQ